MKPQHDAEHEGILAAILTGELEREAALVRTSLRDCKECLDVLEDLEALRGELDELGSSTQTDLAAAAAMPETPLSDVVESVLGPRLRGTPERRPPSLVDAHRAEPTSARWMRRIAIAMGAAAAVLFLLDWFQPRQQPTKAGQDQQQLLGGSEYVRAVAPVGDSQAWNSFHWDAVRPDCLYEVRVHRFEESGSIGSDPELVSPRSQATEWEPTPAALNALPDRIRWELRVLDATGRYLDPVWSDTTRRP